MATQDWAPMILRKSKSAPTTPRRKTVSGEDDDTKTPLMPRNVCSQLSAARAAKGMTQRQLALALNIDTKTVQLVEQGKYPRDMALAQRMARKLGIVIKK